MLPVVKVIKAGESDSTGTIGILKSNFFLSFNLIGICLNSFKKNDMIYSVNSDEFHSSVKQARSELQNLIASVLPDLKIDFSDNGPP